MATTEKTISNIEKCTLGLPVIVNIGPKLEISPDMSLKIQKYTWRCFLSDREIFVFLLEIVAVEVLATIYICHTALIVV